MRRLLGRIRRKLFGQRPEPDLTIDSVESYHLDRDVAEAVRTRMLTGQPRGRVDGSRSALLPHPGKPGFDIKIKGAGLYLGPIQFGRLHRSGLKMPLFDFEGRMMEDVASGHDAAWLGGASFQQVMTEYRMTALLAGKGYEVLPCLGYGRVSSHGMVSWFSVHEPRSDWIAYTLPALGLEDYRASYEAVGRLQLELAVEHAVIGYPWWVGKPGGPRLIKDLHAFRRADPINMSQISWTMQLFFCLHVQSLSIRHSARKNAPDTAPADIQVAPFRGAYPGVTLADHEALRRDLVAPYMLGTPDQFDVETLLGILRGNPLTAAIMEHCPPRYSRWPTRR
jgi:hypothetical protein